jgi:PKD repeat protein
MKKTKMPFLVTSFVFLFAWTTAFLTSAQDPEFVRVTVRFAKARILPAANARIVREIGFGTMLRVQEKSGDYLLVAPLNAPATAGAEPWYVLRSEVENAAAAEAQALVETRRLTFSPAAPAAGQPLLFTASRFSTPNLLKWDMGDGTVLTRGGKFDKGEDATLSYAYASPGQYLVRVFDEGGKDGLPPVTAQVTVSAYSPSLRVSPDQPVANHSLAITALNFREPEKIAWDLGDGTRIEPGAGPGVVKPTFLISHAYEKAGTYIVKAYDSGDRDKTPVMAEVRVEADPRRIRVQPAQALAGTEMEFSAVSFNTPDRLRWDMGDGTLIPSEKEKGVLIGSTVNFRYRKPGRYTVKVYDWGGDHDRLPVQLTVEVGAPAPGVEITAAPRPAVTEAAPPAEQPRPARKKYSLIKIGPYAGYFFPQDALLKQIYGEGDVIYGGRLGVHIWNGFHAWISAAQFKSIAGTTFTQDKTTLVLFPISFFLRYNVGSGFFIPYAGVGYTFMSFREESPDYLGNKTGSGSNVSFEAGFELKVNRNFFLDFGARFDQIMFKPEFSDGKIDLGGLQAGISLLVSF